MIDQPGRFVWYELLTTDVAAAGAFYSEVVGWSMQDASAAGLAYSLLMTGEAPVAGLMDIPPEGLRLGATPRWVGYVAVDDVDATAAQIRRLGGAIYVPPTDSNIGRIAVVADPQGATFALVTGLTYGQSHRGEVQESGRVGWHELLAEDGTRIFDFYGTLFGWQKPCSETDPEDVYQWLSAGGQTIGGISTKLPNVTQPFWLYYLNVEDIDVAAKRVNAFGGRVLQGPIELPGGCRIVRCTDPQGAMFALQDSRNQKGAEHLPAAEVRWSARWGSIASRGRVVFPQPKR